jgi:hypothetical protein
MFSFIETKLFSRLVADVLTDEEYSDLQKALIEDPEAGDLIPVQVVSANYVGA